MHQNWKKTAVTQRLADRFQIDDLVEVYLTTPTGAGWQPGKVVGAEHPGLWVVVAGTFWFVTNGRRIRPASTIDHRR
jgi:hypothetical protein